MRFLLVLSLLLISSIASSAKLDTDQLTSPAECVRILNKGRNTWRQYNQQVWGHVDPQQGGDHLREVLALNKQLEQRPWSFEDLVRAGLVEIDTSDVTNPNQQGVMPFYTMKLPKIFTGLYFPSHGLSKEDALIDPSAGFNREHHQAINILIPGIGTTLSTALGMAPLNGTYSKLNDYKPHLGDTAVDPKAKNPKIKETGYRAYSVMLDATFNGLGEQTPFAFATPQGTVAMIRHAQLVLQHIFNHNKFFVVGRSHGGLYAMYYAKKYGPKEGMYGAVACNPTGTFLNSMMWTQYATLRADTVGLLGDDMQPHPRSWLVHNLYTDQYDLSGASKAPVFTLHSLDDTMSYPQDEYTEFLSQWVADDPENHMIEVYKYLDPNRAHNLFDRTDVERYTDVTGKTTLFFKRSLDI